MRYDTALALFFLCVSSCAQARSGWENPFHEPRARAFLMELTPEYDSLSFMHVQEELQGCLYDYVNKMRKKGPKTLKELNPFVLHALGACERNVLAVVRSHDQIFGQGSGITYIERYMKNVREYVRDFFKVPVVEAK